MSVIDNALFCGKMYGQTMTNKPVPCPIHGIQPIVVVDITSTPHQGKVFCRNAQCKLKTIGDPADVIRKWNELCGKEADT